MGHNIPRSVYVGPPRSGRTLIRMKTVLATALTAAFLTLPAAPATAGEIRDDVVTRSSSDVLSQAEARRVVKRLLNEQIGPSVASDTKPLHSVAAWGCLEQTETQAVCQGSVKGGAVLCRGTFKVYEFAERYIAFPIRMQCGV